MANTKITASATIRVSGANSREVARAAAAILGKALGDALEASGLEPSPADAPAIARNETAAR